MERIDGFVCNIFKFLPCSGKFSPGVKFCQVFQSVEAAKIKPVNFFSIDDSRFCQVNHDSTKMLASYATPQ